MIGVFVKWIPWPPLAMVSARCMIASACLWTTLLLRQRAARSEGPGLQETDAGSTNESRRGPSPLAFLFGGALLAGHWGALFSGYRVGDVGPVVVAVFTYPVLTSLAEPLVHRKAPSLRQVATALLGAAGVAYMALGPTATQAMANNREAIGFGLLSAVLFSARNIQARALMKQTDAITLMAWQVSVAALVLSPFMLQLTAERFRAEELLLVVVLGVFFTAAPHTLTVWALNGLSAAAAGIIGSLQVVSGILAAVVFLGEQTQPAVWLGAFAVIGAVSWETLVNWQLKQRSGRV